MRMLPQTCKQGSTALHSQCCMCMLPHNLQAGENSLELTGRCMLPQTCTQGKAALHSQCCMRKQGETALNSLCYMRMRPHGGVRTQSLGGKSRRWHELWMCWTFCMQARGKYVNSTQKEDVVQIQEKFILRACITKFLGY